jgi:hypothetical protein
VVFLEREEQAMLDKLQSRFKVHCAMYYPLDMDSLISELEQQAAEIAQEQA